MSKFCNFIENKLACLFCLEKTHEGIPIFGDSREAKNVRNLILTHFWFDTYEINTKGSHLCTECWSKLQTFSEFYHKVKLIHHNRFKTKDDTVAVNTTSNPGTEKAAAGGENGDDPKVDLLPNLQNKTKESSNLMSIHNANNANNPVTIKKRTLKLNSNSGQSREISLQIEEDGRNVRCNILKVAEAMGQAATSTKQGSIPNRPHTQTTSTNRNEETESESESESEHIDISNHPARPVKMEEELIILDDDTCTGSANELNANMDEGEGEDDQQSDANPKPKRPPRRAYQPGKSAKCNICGKILMESSIIEHQARRHKMCRKCKQTFSSYQVVSAHMLECRCYCDFCDRSFEKINNYKVHMKMHHRERKERLLNKQNERAAEQTVTPTQVGTTSSRLHAQTIGTNRNEETESESESESERIDMSNHSARPVKIEEELIILDDDTSTGSSNEFNANMDEDEDEYDQQFDAKPQPKRRKRKYRQTCVKCKQVCSSYEEAVAHMQKCREKQNEKVLKGWASLITEK